MASNHSALIPNLIGSWSEQAFSKDQTSKIATALASVGFGVLLLSCLSQVIIPLPWTPVPITGQTFGVALIGLLWGRSLGLSTMFAYLGVAALGAPVLAGAAALSVMPTLGYLVGMCFSVVVVGELSERGLLTSFWMSLAALYVGSIFVFGFGLWGLSYYMPFEALLVSGVLPFLPGDLLKNILAASIYTGIRGLK